MKRRWQELAERGIRGVIQVERLLAAALLVVVCGTMAAQVLARYVFGRPIAWSEELARFALIWLAFIAAALVMAEGRHITVDVVSAWLGPRARLRLDCFTNGLVMLTCLMLLIGGWRFVWRVGLVGSPALGIPMSWWYAAASVGLLLMALHCLLELLMTGWRGVPLRVSLGLDEESRGSETGDSA